MSTCDIIPECAVAQAKEFKVPNHFPHIDKLLAGPDFELLVNLTDMQEHEHLNREAIAANKHIWSEKPIANSLAAGQELLAESRKRGLRLWGAPIVVASPQFTFMAKALASGALGRVASAHANYGHQGPDWSAFFYEKGGGSMPDLGVYNLTSLTGLLGPAKSVTAMLSVVTPTRTIVGKGKPQRSRSRKRTTLWCCWTTARASSRTCSAGSTSSIRTDTKASNETRHTIQFYGSKGYMGLVGYDWEPLGVDLASETEPHYQRHATDAEGYIWQKGAYAGVRNSGHREGAPVHTRARAARCGNHLLRRESQATGKRVDLKSTFKWPVVS